MNENELIHPHAQIACLDEFRMAILPEGYHTGTMELTVFNTLIPQHHPGNMRRLELPQPFYGQHWTSQMHLDGDSLLGTLNRDEPLIADPAQAVLVVELANSQDLCVFLVIRTQALIDQTFSTCAPNSLVPWDEWRGDTVAMEVQMHNNDPEIFIHGARVVLVWPDPVSEPNLRGTYSGVQVLDFSRRGRSSMQPPDGGRGGTGSVVPLEGGRCFRIYPSDAGATSEDQLRSLSDGSFFYLVGCRPQSAGRGIVS